MVITLFTHAAVTPIGKPVAVPIPVAPVVACVILVKVVLMHKVGLVLAAPTVLAGFTVTSTANGAPEQPLAVVVGVTIYLTTPAVVVVLVNICAIGPATPVV